MSSNPFIINIVDLQNVQSNILGISQINQIQSDVQNIQKMVIYDTKTIAADTITNFTQGKDLTISATTSAQTNTTSLSSVYDISGSLQGPLLFSANRGSVFLMNTDLRPTTSAEAGTEPTDGWWAVFKNVSGSSKNIWTPNTFTSSYSVLGKESVYLRLSGTKWYLDTTLLS